MGLSSDNDPSKKQVSPTDGFTLVELLVVLGIVALIAAVATPQVLRYLDDARVTTTRTQINSINSALELFYLDTGRYPTREEGLVVLVEKPTAAEVWRGPYLRGETALVDAWSNSFIYALNPETGRSSVISHGRDGLEGGEGIDADISG